jgi:chromosome segregation ATPase
MSESDGDAQVRAEIERLRQEFPNTQDLYREACVLLFFRFGITPTANKLYHLVRKGSMSAPAEALQRFWETLRERSRVRIEHPDLPEELRAAVGEFAGSLWQRAQAAAQEELGALREQAQRDVAAAQEAQRKTQEHADELAADLEGARRSIDQSVQRFQELNNEMAAERASRAAQDERLAEAQREQARLHEAQAQQRRDFAAELDRIRSSAQVAEDRLRAAEERALSEIERQRSAFAGLQQQLEAARHGVGQAQERSREEMRLMQGELVEARQRAATLEGGLVELQAAKRDLTAELTATRAELVQRFSDLAVASHANEAAGTRIQALEHEIRKLLNRLPASLPTEPGGEPAEPSVIRRAKRPPVRKDPTGDLL